MMAFRRKLMSYIPQYRIKLQLPDKFKGTFVERGVKYMEGLLHDYNEVFSFVVKETRERPFKTAPYYGLLGFFTYAIYHNPNEFEYRNRIIEYQNLYGLVGKPVRNPGADVYLKMLENSHNFGLIRRLSLGFISFIWLDNYDEALGLYKAQCDYLKPKYLNFYKRIIDVGFLDKFWMLEEKMKEYDVNPNEWIDFTKTEYEYRH